MSTSSIVWLVIAAVVAVLLIAVLLFAGTRASNSRRLRQAEGIREQARLGSREDLQQQWGRADSIDPNVKENAPGAAEPSTTGRHEAPNN